MNNIKDSKSNLVQAGITIQEEETDPYYYGWRYEKEDMPDGTYQIYKIALPPERFLNPQEGDQFVRSGFHNNLVRSIQACYKNRYANDNITRVFGDVKIAHGISDLAAPAPDISVVPNCIKVERYSDAFDVKYEETCPMLVIEVASPRYPFDRQKISIYEQVGIQEYIIVDPHWENKNTKFEFFGYHLVNSRYQPMIKDEQGRLYSATTDTYLFFEANENGKVTEYITDGTTGERVLNSEQSSRERLIQAVGRRAAEARAEAEAAERQAAEERAQAAAEKAEAEATERRAAEKRAQAAAEQAKAEATERQAAEERAQAAAEKAEAEATERRAAEEGMAEALAEVARLKVLLAQQKKGDK